MPSPTDSLLIASVSARAIASLYSVALLASVVVGVAAAVGWLLRASGAEARALVWRSSIVAVLVVFIGRQLPLQWVAWVVPSVLAQPLVALGRVQVTAPSSGVGPDAINASSATAVGLTVLLVVYGLGVSMVLVPTLTASLQARRWARRARDAGPAWDRLVSEARHALGVQRSVRVAVSDDAIVAMTWGIRRPVVMLPLSVETWTVAQRRMVLLHELAHVRAADWIFGLAARVVCALFWFHPGVWWLSARLRESCELACDERVLDHGVRRSDYAELLVRAADLLAGVEPVRDVAFALARPSGLRARLAAVLDPRRVSHPLARGSVAATLALTIVAAGPASVAQLAPTRAVLTTLMLDAEWQSRAYAVIGLAQRADSVAMARSAAELDPNPRVRAWAKFALDRHAGAADLRAILRDR